MRTLFIFLFLPLVCFGQYKGVSYELRNEIGTYTLTSKTFSHRIDNEEGITIITGKSGNDTLYTIDRFLNGYVGLSNDGRTVVHVQTEQNSQPLPQLRITLFRNGKTFDSAELGKFLKYELDDAIGRGQLPKSGWLRNDSLYHKMASNAFYVTDDKVFVSIDGPLLQVFDLNRMFHIYAGNGANHFLQNYYSIPNLPFRTEFNASEYFPKGFPRTVKDEEFATVVASILGSAETIPEEASLRVEMELKLNSDASFDLRKANVFSTMSNELNQEQTELLKAAIQKTELQTSLLPPDHPAWIFSGNFWLK